jgi:hypothetical protein
LEGRGAVTRAAVALLGVFACTACNLLQLDDFALQPCHEDIDCYALSHARPGSLTQCYRCNAGRCEPQGDLTAKTINTVNPLAWLSTASGPEQTTLLAVGPLSDSEPARGFAIADAAVVEKGSVKYTGTPQLTNLRALALGWSDSTHLIGMSVDTSTCSDGLVRIGLSTSADPFTLDPSGEGSVFTTGVDTDPTTGCTKNEVLGAREPAIAATAGHAGEAEALAVWLATNQVGFSSGGRCAGSDDSFATLRGLRLALHETTDGATFEPIGYAKSAQVADHVLASTAPQLVAAQSGSAPSYLLGYVDADGVQLRVIPAFTGASSLDADASATLTLADGAADQLALAVGAATAIEQTALIVWSSGCGQTTELRAAVLHLAGRELELSAGPFGLRTGGPILSAPRVAYATRGFTQREPHGGWAVVWSEGTAHATRLQVSRIGESAPLLETPETLFAGDATWPFMHAPHAAPFAYGFAVPSADGRADMTLMSCE